MHHGIRADDKSPVSEHLVKFLILVSLACGYNPSQIVYDRRFAMTISEVEKVRASVYSAVKKLYPEVDVKPNQHNIGKVGRGQAVFSRFPKEIEDILESEYLSRHPNGLLFRQLYQDDVGNIWRTEQPHLDPEVLNEISKGPPKQYLRLQARNDALWQRDVLNDIKLRMAWMRNGRNGTISPIMKHCYGLRITGRISINVSI